MSDPSLSAPARAAIRDGENEVYVSAASAWEITTKFRGGKASNLASISGDVEREVIAEGFTELRSEEHTSELQSLMRISYAVFCLNKKNEIKLHIRANSK